MHGIIKFVVDDEQYRFKGAISGDDGAQYNFNSLNWSKRNIAISELCEGQSVEFELKEPNKYGVIYPKNIRFQGETVEVYVPNDYTKVAHSHGRFNDFISVKTDAIIMALEELVEDFANLECTATGSMYKRIATTFNGLQDKDFRFGGSGDDEYVDFPIDFATSDGQAIFLRGVKKKNSRVPWHADRVVVSGVEYGQPVFSIINANWYEIEDSINEIVPENKKSAVEITRRIEKRCFNRKQEFVYLKKGQVCTGAEADELYVPTGFYEESGKEIYLFCVKKNGMRGYGWYFEAATYEDAPITVFDKKLWLEKWAGYLGNDVFEQLAGQTLEEQWSFGKRTDYGILKNYLRYTFSYQLTCGAISYSQDMNCAAFNTGLPDRNSYKYLYAFFEKKDSGKEQEVHPLHHRQEYLFKGFVCQGRGGEGKILSSQIRPLPAPPKYFKARSATVWELDFNDSNQITIPEYDDTHILIQRCERIPLNFYRLRAGDSPRLVQILNSDASLVEKYKEIKEYFKPIVDNEPNDEVTIVYRTLTDALESVISKAVRKLSWNWRAVVPCYNPERDETCYLLPVSFCDPTKPDRAMIASVNKINEEYIYTIHTVIPLDWAYLDARLVCRPESEWLAANFIDEEEI